MDIISLIDRTSQKRMIFDWNMNSVVLSVLSKDIFQCRKRKRALERVLHAQENENCQTLSEDICSLMIV